MCACNLMVPPFSIRNAIQKKQSLPPSSQATSLSPGLLVRSDQSHEGNPNTTKNHCASHPNFYEKCIDRSLHGSFFSVIRTLATFDQSFPKLFAEIFRVRRFRHFSASWMSQWELSM